jgi:hypothetical protein
MEGDSRSQARNQRDDASGWAGWRGPGRELITPNPKLKLLEQVRKVMRLKHYSIRTERCYCDWIRRYVKFHGMRSREDLGFGMKQVTVRDGKGAKDRYTVLPGSLAPTLQAP